eukprot:TRINITY_DN37797_c0_g1_i1.p1 TRINITY_DN37797_c0_g1~~TRINITY_DN37797_c0_g1_i1.p1  ORF type:complete len:388 (-),score=69.45 TRINITY_DN37797_c0_g1_i1:91-1254(-)
MVEKQVRTHSDNSLGVSSRAYLVGGFVAAVVGSAMYVAFTHMPHVSLQTLLLLITASGASILITVFLAAYYISGVCMCPPWYKPSLNPSQGLTQDMLPEYWQGIQNDPKTDLGLDYDDVEFVNTVSGATLRGWHVPPKGTPKDVAAVLVHGGGRDRRAFLRHVPIFHDNGYSCLLFDFSEHGCSDGTGRGFTYGVREHHDVTAAVRFAKDTLKFKHIVVVATSVGATASIMAAALDTNIDAVVAENPLTRAEELLQNIYWKGIDYFLGKRWSRNLVTRAFGRILVAVFLMRIGAIEEDHLWSTHKGAIDLVHAISPRPILIMHGTNDNIIPHSHSERIHAVAREPKEIWLAKGAVHCALYDKYPDEYRERVLGFMDRVHQVKCQGKK